MADDESTSSRLAEAAELVDAVLAELGVSAEQRASVPADTLELIAVILETSDMLRSTDADSVTMEELLAILGDDPVEADDPMEVPR